MPFVDRDGCRATLATLLASWAAQFELDKNPPLTSLVVWRPLGELICLRLWSIANAVGIAIRLARKKLLLKTPLLNTLGLELLK